MDDIPQHRELRGAAAEHRRQMEAYARTSRFYLVVTLALACISLFALKIDGPFFADGIAAGLFTCGAMTAVVGIRSVRASRAELRASAARKFELEQQAGLHEGETEPQHKEGSVTLALYGLCVFFLLAATLTVWLTYISPPETPVEEDVQASTWQVRAY